MKAGQNNRPPYPLVWLVSVLQYLVLGCACSIVAALTLVILFPDERFFGYTVPDSVWFDVGLPMVFWALFQILRSVSSYFLFQLTSYKKPGLWQSLAAQSIGDLALIIGLLLLTLLPRPDQALSWAVFMLICAMFAALFVAWFLIHPLPVVAVLSILLAVLSVFLVGLSASRIDKYIEYVASTHSRPDSTKTINFNNTQVYRASAVLYNQDREQVYIVNNQSKDWAVLSVNSGMQVRTLRVSSGSTSIISPGNGFGCQIPPGAKVGLGFTNIRPDQRMYLSVRVEQRPVGVSYGDCPLPGQSHPFAK